MSNDFFGQLCFFMFVDIPTAETGDQVRKFDVRMKRVKLATVYCKRSDCEANVEQFKAINSSIARKVQAEFNFREHL
jgi:hypothetical protein